MHDHCRKPIILIYMSMLKPMVGKSHSCQHSLRRFAVTLNPRKDGVCLWFRNLQLKKAQKKRRVVRLKIAKSQAELFVKRMIVSVIQISIIDSLSFSQLLIYGWSYWWNYYSADYSYKNPLKPQWNFQKI